MSISMSIHMSISVSMHMSISMSIHMSISMFHTHVYIHANKQVYTHSIR